MAEFLYIIIVTIVPFTIIGAIGEAIAILTGYINPRDFR